MATTARYEYVMHSPYSVRNRAARALWAMVSALLFRVSPRPFHRWRAFLLRCFGAKLGHDCHVYPKAIIWAPWNLECGDSVTIGDGANVYNPKVARLGSSSIISQDAYVCGATHDYEDPSFPVVSYPIELGPYSWVCARAIVSPGAALGEGAVLALGSVATHSLEPWAVYGGVPARKLKDRAH